jgi:NADH-quinone oxidoreductase subunit C
MSQRILERLKEHFGDAVEKTETQHGDDLAWVKKEKIREVISFLRDDAELQMNMPTDLTAIDYFGHPKHPEDAPRFEVVYNLYSTVKKHRVRVKCRVTEEDCTIDSVHDIFPGWNWFEREAWDMYGVKFKGHPDLRRLFMYEEFVGHALRKDYPKEKRQPLVRREGVS